MSGQIGRTLAASLSAQHRSDRSGDFLSQLNILCVANGRHFDTHYLLYASGMPA